MFRHLALTLLLVGCSPALAATTDWVEVAPGARLRLIANDELAPDGTTLIGLQADLPAGTRTYWRVPGESGIPTEIDLAGSTGISSSTTLWPFPTIDTSAGVLDYVYSGDTVLPVSARAAGSGAVVKASVSMGICSDVCVPVSAKFTLPLDFARPDTAQAIRLKQAVANTPIAWNGAPDAIGELRYDATAKALRIDINDSGIDALSVLAEAPGDDPLFGAPQKSPDNRGIILPLLGTTPEKGLEGEPIRLTFMTQRGPYETVRDVAFGK
jgi:DsbC/DsbD-like thiol-disulfide interchange protein